MPAGIVDYGSKILVTNKHAVITDKDRFKPTSDQNWHTGGRLRQEMEKRAQDRMNALKQLKKINFERSFHDSRQHS